MQRFNRVTAAILVATLLPGLAGAADLQLIGLTNTPTTGAPIESIRTSLAADGKVLETVTARPNQFECYQSVLAAINGEDNVVNFITQRPPGFQLPGDLGPMRNIGNKTSYGNAPGIGAQVRMNALASISCYASSPSVAGSDLRVIINGHDQTYLFQNTALNRAVNIATLNIRDGNYCRRTDDGQGLLLQVSNWAPGTDATTSGAVRFNNDEFILRGRDLIINAPIVCGQGSGNVDYRRFLMAFNSHTGADGYKDPTALAVFDHVSRGAGGNFWFTDGPKAPGDFFYLVTESRVVASGTGSESDTGFFRTNGGLENIRNQIGLANEPVEFNLVGKVELINPTPQHRCATIAVQSRFQARITPGGAIGDYDEATDFCTKDQPFDVRIGRSSFAGLLNKDRPIGFFGDEVFFIEPGKTIDTTPRCAAQDAAAFAGRGTQYGYFMGACRKVGWVNINGLTVQVNLPDVPGFN